MGCGGHNDDLTVEIAGAKFCFKGYEKSLKIFNFMIILIDANYYKTGFSDSSSV